MSTFRHWIRLCEARLWIIDSPQGLTEAVHVDSPQFRAWFNHSKVVDAHGQPLPVFHGTGRPDRVGTTFRRSRATAGPMAYFTDDPDIASGYATGKPDTSFEGEDNYAGWFKVKLPGHRSLVDIGRCWYFLNDTQRKHIAELAPRVANNEGDIYLADDNHTNGVGNLDYEVRAHRGNYLQALVGGWLEGGVLFNDEQEFIKVLALVGFPYRVEMHHPHATYPTVYSVFLSIQNPLDTQNIPQKVYDALTKVGQRRPSKNYGYTVGQWEKKTADANEWLRGLLADMQTGTNFHWTVIPDWVTKVLQGLGYDGIQDRGGKNQPGQHTVWIPFTETQVKSAISNTNFDPSQKNIHK